MMNMCTTFAWLSERGCSGAFFVFLGRICAGNPLPDAVTEAIDLQVFLDSPLCSGILSDRIGCLLRDARLALAQELLCSYYMLCCGILLKHVCVFSNIFVDSFSLVR